MCVIGRRKGRGTSQHSHRRGQRSRCCSAPALCLQKLWPRSLVEEMAGHFCSGEVARAHELECHMQRYLSLGAYYCHGLSIHT